MCKIKIGILGSTGSIGKELLKIIDCETYCVYTQSKKPRSIVSNHYYFDINDIEKLKSFVELCDIVINCIGPSYKYSVQIYELVNKLEKYYIDPFGATLIESTTRSGNVILSGEYPGFTGIVLKYISNCYFDNIFEVEFYYKPSGEITDASMFDFVESVTKQFGKTGYYYKNGDVIISKNKELNVKIKNKNNIAIDFFTTECLIIADELNLNKFYFRNVFDNKIQIEKLKNCLNNKILLGNIGIDQINIFEGDEVIYYIKCNGMKKEVYKNIDFEISFNSSNIISAFVIKEVIESIIKFKDINKSQLPYMIIDVNKFVDNLIELDMINFKVNEKECELGIL